MVVGFVCMGCAGIAFLFKCAIFWWCVVLRATQDGKVAAGKMVMECEAEWGTSPVASAIDTAATALTGDSNRLLQDTVNDTMNDAAIEMGVPVCNDMDAFQIKGGKFMLAWIIISALKCI